MYDTKCFNVKFTNIALVSHYAYVNNQLNILLLADLFLLTFLLGYSHHSKL
jgi:hypothetical protein